MDILAREGAPLNDEEWAALDMTVVETARKYLVGRRFISLFGPMGVGMPVVPATTLDGFEPGGVIRAGEPRLLPLETISQDFALTWQSLETPRRLGVAPDLAAAAAAAALLVAQEEELIFSGCQHCGAGGLLNAPGAGQLKGAKWAEAGALFGDVVKALDKLGSAGFPGPYAVALAPATYASVHRAVGNGVQLEIELIRDLAKSGVFASPAVAANQALVLETGAQNLDLAVGADLQTAYIGNEGMEHLFRIFETLALRVKRPQAIVLIKGS